MSMARVCKNYSQKTTTNVWHPRHSSIYGEDAVFLVQAEAPTFTGWALFFGPTCSSLWALKTGVLAILISGHSDHKKKVVIIFSNQCRTALHGDLSWQLVSMHGCGYTVLPYDFRVVGWSWQLGNHGFDRCHPPMGSPGLRYRGNGEERDHQRNQACRPMLERGCAVPWIRRFGAQEPLGRLGERWRMMERGNKILWSIPC